MKEYLDFMGQFLGGLLAIAVGVILLVKQIDYSMENDKATDDYGAGIKIYTAAIIFIIVGAIIFIKAL